MAKTKTVNSISGGKTSAYISVHYPADYEVFSLVCINDQKSRPKDKKVTDYVNNKLEKFRNEFGEFIATAEDDATLVAMMDLEQYIGREIIWVRGMSFDDVIDKGTQTRLPSWARRYCTEKMKLLPIFYWWFNNIGGDCNMRIGFRFDEYDRMERFFNYSDPTNFRIPIACKTYGQKKQILKTFNWRYCSFPLIKNSITKDIVSKYWQANGWIDDDLFGGGRRQIKFPAISNCVGCFHKKPETLAVMWNLNESKMKWFAEQEKKEMGTWLDSMITYEQIGMNREDWIEEMIKDGSSCDSGGCTD